jgi:CubicO group peptidase (beta-lactamase class C family)
LNTDWRNTDFLTGMTTSYPYTAPMERPAYSNVAFTVFTIALERITGKTYAQLLDEFVVHPYGLKNTFPSPGNDSLAVIPPQESNWGTDYGLSTP